MLKPLTEPQRLWLEALRSGQYSQTSCVLQTEQGYCCLGVAARVAAEHGVQIYEKGSGILVGSTLAAQTPVMHWLGLKTISGSMNAAPHLYGKSIHLTHLNDRFKLTFAELADVIEWNADLLFEDIPS